ncbi:protein TASOR 2 isoform X2 [Onychostoma macrolepis]|uniref:protein TASOR 2 isoform X2 n=1 Tax=Onychostoma macrolepis TaxID=369639 RepID=UPI00272C7D77|nr:protein TASOR 2 isoform X2 [Onychostoma macrolepis]
MENETTRSTEGLLEPVHPGSVTFNESILAPLHNNYLYEESKECFTYNSAHLINNGALQKRYAAFRSEKREKGYSEQELEESFGFLLLDDANRARKIGETGLLVGQAKCTTLGDSSKGVYISKYSDCLDLKRWYDGKTGYIVLLKLTKGRVKEVTDNYTQNFTPPTAGYDCHISDQLGAVSSTISSFLAYERTQYYMYELHDGSNEIETCPRHACPFAIVAFSYGKMSTTPELEKKSQDKTVFHYQPWIGQFKIESTVYDVGLQSSSGAWFPAKLPKTVQIDHAIGVSELKRTLPREIFETCIVGEVCIDGRCFNLYDVVSSKAKNDLAQIAQELKEKDTALVIPLEDSGFLILLHSTHLFSYEDAKSGKAAALQGMFIFPDSRTVPRDAKSDLQNTKVSTEIMQVIPALNYAETEMEKCPQNQQGRSQMSLEKHLQDYGTLFHPGLLDVPTREASMFPDQYDVPGGFTLISPKWSQEAGTRLKSYFDEPYGFTIPVGRALELLTAGRQQRGDDHDDDVYYCISSPEEVPQTDGHIEMEVTKQSEAISDASDRIAETVKRQKDEQKHSSTEKPQPALPEGLGKLGTAVVTVADSVLEYPTSTVSPKLGDVPTENCVSIENDVEKTSQGSTKGDDDGVGVSTKETPIQTSSIPIIKSTEEGAAGGMEDNTHPEKTIPDPDKKVNRRSFSRRRVNSPDDSTKDQIKTDDINQKPHSTRRGKGRRKSGVNQNLSKARQAQDPLLSVTTETIDDQSTSLSKRDWRSLPRRKRLWNTDDNLKRSLRSDAAKNDEETIENIQHNETKQSLSSTPKRKMEGFNLRERYGLKTIITNCGRVFVPHGSDVDVESAKKEKTHVEMSIDTNAGTISPVENKSKEIVESKGESPLKGKEELPSKDPLVNDDEHSDSPSKDMPNALLSALRILRKLHKTHPSESDKSQDLCPEKSTNDTSNVVVGVQQNNKDHPVAVQADATSSVPGVSDQSTHSDPKVSSPDKTKKKGKHVVYSAISISKLKTVLRRGKKGKSPTPGDSAKSEPDNAEPESKKGKFDLKCDAAQNELTDKGSQPTNEEAQLTPMKGAELTKQPVSWRGLIHKASKENGSLNFDTSAPFEIAKHADPQLITSFIGDRVGRRRISTDGKASAERLSTGASLPSDALSLLADLALGANNDKMLNLEAKAGQEALDGVKASGSPESVLHALLRYPSARFKLPPRSPFPEGLLVTGELILEISKEHSYSQPTSPLSGLSGPSPKVSFPSGSVESPLSLKTGLHLNLPKDAVASCHQEEGDKAEWEHLISPNKPSSEILKTKRRSRILRNRTIIEKEGMIQVTRIWKEPYDFKFDSKFTNDSKDKTVTRALHGKWKFSIEDTYEDIHLIFHMWIGLFYSKPTSRLFHLENCTALPKEKNVEMVHLDINAIQNAVSLLNVDLSQKADSAKPVHVSSEVLDLSVKNDEPVSLHSVSDQSKSKDTASQPGEISSHKHETALRRSPSGTSLSSSPKVTALMNYRTAVDVPVESSVPDNNDIDEENDITNDCSYSQHLEKNSAYSQLCEQASNMRIGVRILQPKVRNATNNKASTSIATSGPQKIGVFHQILGPIKPSAFSKQHRLILGRKRFDLGLKNEIGHVPHVILQKEKVSDSAESKEIFEAMKERKKDGCPEAMVNENVDETVELKTGASVLVEEESVSVAEERKVVSDEGRRDRCLTVMEDGSVEENMTSETPSQDQTNITEHKETVHVKEDLKTSLDLKDHANMVDEPRDDSSHETNVEEHNETPNITEEPKPVLDDTSLVDHVDELSDISSDETRTEELNETSNTNEELKHVHDLKDHANMADELKDALSEETNIEECNEYSNAKEELDLKKKSNVVDASSLETEGNDTKEPVEAKECYTGEEMMQESEIKSKEEADLVGSDTEHETSTSMEEYLDDFTLVLEDDINSVDMEFSDEDSETKVRKEVYEQNISTDKSSDFTDGDHDMKMHKSEKQPQTPEQANFVDGALEEFRKDSCPGVDQLMSVQEKHTLAANNDASDVMHDEGETKTTEQSIVVQQEALDVCQDESKPTSTVEPTKIDISHLEKDDERDLGQQDAFKVTGEDDTLFDENETQSQGSCEDQMIESNQECLSLKICASLPNTTTDSRDEAVALIDKPSEVQENSMCSTPTRDEIPCYPEVNKGFRKEDLNRDLYYPDDTDHADMMPPKSPVSPQPHVSTMKPLSDFIGHYEEIHNDNLRWCRNRYTGTMDFKEKSTTTTEHSPNEDSFPLKHKLYLTSQQKDDCNFIEGASQNDSELYYRDDLHGYYHRSDEDTPWHDCHTVESIDHRFYPCGNDSVGDNDSPICSKYITSERDYSYKHKKHAKKERDDYCWAEKNYKSDTLSFKYPIKVTCTADYETEVARSSKKKSRKSKFPDAFCQNAEWNDSSDSIKKTSYFETYQTKPTRLFTVSSTPHVKPSTQQFDWRRYFRREVTCSQLLDASERDNKFDIPPSSLVTILDRKGNRVIFNNSPTMKPSFDGSSLTKGLEDSFNEWQEQQSKADVTRSALDCEYLIFSQKVNRVLKETKSSTASHCRSNPDPASCPMTVRFSNLSEVENSAELSKAQPSLTDFKIKVDMSDGKEMRETLRNRKPHLQRLFCEKSSDVEFSGISEITEQCAVTYKSMMNDVCSGKTMPCPTEARKRKFDRDRVGRHSGFCGRIKKDVFDSPKSIVSQAKIKYRFYILVTSTDTFFEETKNLLEIEGHRPVEPDDFDLNGDDQSPLLIILRNEDIAAHICEVPYLLELKKSPSVLFAGIDRPDDVVNFTHQELFAKGGFIVCDELALNTLTLDDMKKVAGILEELDKQGKWKWFLHYRDSRRLRETARSSPEASKKQQFLDCCQKAGIVEVLPYHDCDVMSRDRPDYLFCLTRLQIQNASVRFPVFITDTPTESFGTNGILTMNIYTFSRILSNDTCSVS